MDIVDVDPICVGMAYETERKMTTWSKSSTETRDL
jgi:hypothetical protein